ncbi:MAG: DUF4159 domain-containing protein [Gemmatimonadota bacterium]
MRISVSTVLALAAVTLLGLSGVGDPKSASTAPSEGAHGGSGFYGVSPSQVGGAPTLMARAPSGSPPQAAPFLPRPGDTQEIQEGLPVPDEYREFYFTRAIYRDYASNSFWARRRPSWAIDYPKADRQFLTVLKNLIDIDAYDRDNAVRLDDPRVRRYPFLYALEVGRMDLDDAEVEGLRGYLEAGGFLVIDDFWGPREWGNFEYQMSRVLPGRPIERLSLDHPIFNMVYDIEEVRQVPNVGNGTRGGPTWECRGCYPEVFGIHDDSGRLMVVINWNTDLGDAWEWAENPYYPLEYSTFAYEMGVNMVVYGMSH